MVFKYSHSPSSDPSYSFFLQPLINVRLIRGLASVPLVGLLDTGATLTVLNASIAKTLFIDWKTGKRTNIMGIEGKQIPAYLHDLEIEIPAIPNSRVKSRIAFAHLPTVGVLLGQYGFFEHFKITFDAKQESFEIDLLP
jgi:predicted aspartyl protease